MGEIEREGFERSLQFPASKWVQLPVSPVPSDDELCMFFVACLLSLEPSVYYMKGRINSLRR